MPDYVQPPNYMAPANALQQLLQRSVPAAPGLDPRARLAAMGYQMNLPGATPAAPMQLPGAVPGPMPNSSGTGQAGVSGIDFPAFYGTINQIRAQAGLPPLPVPGSGQAASAPTMQLPGATLANNPPAIPPQFAAALGGNVSPTALPNLGALAPAGANALSSLLPAGIFSRTG